MCLVLTWTLGLPLLMGTQDAGKKAPPAVDPIKVDEAVRKGVEFLKGRAGLLTQDVERKENPLELVLLTLVHAGVPESDSLFEDHFRRMLEGPLQTTYRVALQAMVLEEVDRVKYQHRIAQCGQFLIDNQCTNGQWSYGEPSPFIDSIPVPTPRKDTATGGKRPSSASKTGKKDDPLLPPGTRIKPKVVGQIVLVKRREGKPQGDNSNSQYALLGLRSCHDAGVVLPREVVERARKWWRDTQQKQGGWSYRREDALAYASMTAGAVGSLTICQHILNEPWLKDPNILRGLEWMAGNFSATENIGKKEFLKAIGQETVSPAVNYYLYGVERVGVLYGTERIGSHEWYPEGAKALIAGQKGSGAWSVEGGSLTEVDSTCFAILFLRRATRPLIDVVSEDPLRSRGR